MTAATAPPLRIQTLDIVRGIAVMGILAMNIVAFAMPPQAYMNPAAYGSESAVDYAVYAFNFVLIDGKMRGLFSFLFGASMLLVIRSAEAKGEDSRSVTFRRQWWLLAFGLIHFYFIWYGDILVGYALVGMLAWHFRDLSPRMLVRWGVGLLLIQLAIMAAMTAFVFHLNAAIAAGGADAEMLKAWNDLTRDIAAPSAAVLREEMSLFLGPWTELARHQLTQDTIMPFIFTCVFGWETLAYMLFGMAALKSGLLTGEWSDAAYRRLALVALGLSVPVYGALAAFQFADDFSVPGLFATNMAATVPVRPVMVIGYAALVILLTRRGGWLTQRFAATGRAAFTNYLGTSIVMTFVFYGWGLGLFGTLSRAELWLVVIAMWALMLAWSKPWLDRFEYGPFEWLWRSLARWEVQRMRKQAPRSAAAAGA